jgi:hypothetical protein
MLVIVSGIAIVIKGGWYESFKFIGNTHLASKVETPIHDNNLILTSIIAPQSG